MKEQHFEQNDCIYANVVVNSKIELVGLLRTDHEHTQLRATENLLVMMLYPWASSLLNLRSCISLPLPNPYYFL